MSELSALWSQWADPLRLGVLGRLLLALVLGGAIGLEREIAGKPAGLRTNMLICVGAVLFTEASLRVAMHFADLGPNVRADPGRIAYGVVTGIGFIGAGTILVLRGTVIGLTSAATLWVVAAIGLVIGLRDYTSAIGATVLVLLTLVAVARFETRFSDKSIHRLKIGVDPDESGGRRELEAILEGSGLRYHVLGFERDEGSTSVSYALHASLRDRDALIHELELSGGVRSVRVD